MDLKGTAGVEDRGAGCVGTAVYEITVKGTLDPTWADWFDGLAITPQPSGETRLSVSVPDQAALHGLLARIRDLSLPLLCVKRQGWVEQQPRVEGRGRHAG